MKRTISFMTGKGSVNHNSRKFHTKNTDPKRSHWNVEYCNQDIQEIYHELFDEALERYNVKQSDGQIAARILDEYMKGFQERNPALRVFSAHLHMDEATPHLHIDFVPYTTGSMAI